MGFNSIKEMLEAVEREQKALWEVLLEEDLKERGSARENYLAVMTNLWQEIKSSVGRYDGNLRSQSGMVGGAGLLMEDFVESGKNISGGYCGRVAAVALKMGESNACMRRIVAAPTAGSCGVLPAALVPYHEMYGPNDERMVEALYVASGIGEVCAARAFISGAEGGCQAEVGVASAMALAGIKNVIPHDEVIDAMRQVGDVMPLSLKETGIGGLAATAEGKKISESMQPVRGTAT